MPCPVAVTGITSTTNPNNPSQANLTIAGTDDGCSIVTVEVKDQTSGVSVSKTTTPGGNTWIVTIDNEDIGCGDTIVVTPICVPKDGAKCQGTPYRTTVQCVGQNPCPTLSHLTAAISTSCNADGTRTVTLSALVTLSGSNSVQVQWQYDAGNYSQVAALSASGTTQTTYNYSPGSYLAHLLVVSPTGCSSASVKFHVDECPVAGCPTLSDPAVQAAANCNEDGTRTVTLSATVTLPATGSVEVIWDYGDSNYSAPTPVSASGNIQTTHDYEPGSYGAQLQVLSPSGCPPLSLGVVVQPCIPCPAFGQATVSYGGCNADGTRTVTLSVSTSGGTGSTVTWNYGDTNYSAPITITSSGLVTATHNYAAGNWNATLSVTNPSVCGVSIEVAVDVPSCTPATCPNVTGLTASLSPGCAGQGNSVTATFSGTVSPPPPAGASVEYQWDFGDGSPAVTSNSPSITHAYSSAGMFAAGVVTICGDCVQQATLEVTIPPCCPQVESLGVTVTGCVGSGSTASGTLVANMNTSPAAGTFIWTFGDGSAPLTTAAPAVIHNYAASGSFSASVTFQPADNSCASSGGSASVGIPACGPNKGGAGGSAKGGCGGLLVTAITLILLGGLLVILGICLGPFIGPVAPVLEAAGGISAGLGLLLFILWIAICAAFTSCGLMQTIYCLLDWLVAVVIPIATILLFIFGGLPCGLATAITGVAWGSIFAWYTFVMGKVHCPTKACF